MTFSKLHKSTAMWVSLVLMLTVSIPQARNGIFQLVGIARAEDLRREQIVRDTTLAITLQILQTQNKILDAITDSTTGIDSVKQEIYLEILREQLDSLRRLLPSDTLREK